MNKESTSIIIATLILMSHAPLAWAEVADCAAIFEDQSVWSPPNTPNTKTDDPFQQKILEREETVRALMGQYSHHLAPYSDPFALAWTSEIGEMIFKRLSIRYQKGKWEDSPLAIINLKIKQLHTDFFYDDKLIQGLIDDATAWLGKSGVERADLQSNLLALKYVTEYLRRFRDPETVVDRDGETPETPEKPEKKEKRGKKPSQDEQDQAPEYPELPDEYRPHTKDTEGQGGGKQKKHRIAEANFKTAYFAQRYYSEIVRGAKTPFKKSVLPTVPPSPPKHQHVDKNMVVRTFGKRRVDLFIPPLHRPLQPSDPRALITRSETGGYVLELKDNLPEIQIPMVDDDGIVMQPHVRELYTRPVGFEKTDWPDGVRIDLLQKYSEDDAKSDPLKVARAVANHLATQYLYSVGPRPESDPIDALKAGAFQCDMAAYTMIGILRDVYGIPSRVVGGFRAKQSKAEKNGKSYLIVPGEAHVWIEVFHDGKWHLFDPTPVKKDKKSEDSGEDPYSDIVPDDQPQPEESENSGTPGEGSGGESPDKSGEKNDHADRLAKDTENRLKNAEVQEKKSQEKLSEEKPPEKKPKENELTKEELAEQLSWGRSNSIPQRIEMHSRNVRCGS